jgi:hypothetical protein
MHVDSLDLAIDEILSMREALVSRRRHLCEELLELTASVFYENARIWYRDGKYAYLNVQIPGGDRVRSYIGMDAVKVASAEIAVARGARISEIKLALRSIDTLAYCYAKQVLRSGV